VAGQLNISVKINLLVFSAIISTLVIVFISATVFVSKVNKTNQVELNQIIHSERKIKLIELTDNASTILEKAQSRNDAVYAVSAMRFGRQKKNYFFVIDDQGRFIAHPERPDLVGTVQIDLQSVDKKFIIRQIIEQSKSQQKGFIQYLWKKPFKEESTGEKLTYFKRIPGKDWTIATGIYNDDIKDLVMIKEKKFQQNVKRAMVSSSGFVFLFAIGFLVLTVFVVRQLLIPLRLVAEFVQHVGSGNLNAELEYSGNDEIGVMAKAIEQAVKDLAVLIKKMISTSTTVAESSVQLISVAQDLKRSSQGMEENASHANQETRHLSEYLKNIFTATQKINTQLDQISDFTDNVSTNTIVVGDNIESVSRSTASASCAIEQMYASFNETAKNSSRGSSVTNEATRMAEDTSSMMSRLGNAAQEIGDIIEMIQAIAAQTHLLSLNAAIEAAGAGEAGKGFFVVANEVKELAHQTETSANVIKKKIVTMQDHTHEAVDVIGSVVQVVSQIDQIMFAIASSIEEQTAVTNDISSNISTTAENAKDLNDKSKENIDAIRQVAVNIEATSTASDLIQKDVAVSESGIEDVLEYMSQANNSVIASAAWIQTIQSQADDLAKLAKDLKQVSQIFKV